MKKLTKGLLQQENVKLEKKLEKKSALLKLMRRNMEIEASLERMRTTAMGLRKTEELIIVCESMYRELSALGFANIRNAQIAIKNDERQTYFVCEYSDYNSTLLAEAPYDSSAIVKEMYNELGKSNDAFYQKEFSGRKFEDWRSWRRSISKTTDSRMEMAVSMCFYLYSFGTGHMGISTFNAITRDQVEILKRFKNVFELSYRRYMDVAKAESLAREAWIQASLERVRAQALSMRKPDDLPGICEVLYSELCTLGFSEIRNAMINIHDDGKGSFVNYDYSNEIGKSINQLFYNTHPLIEKQIRQIRSAGDAFSETSFTGKDLDDWKAFRKKIGEKDDPRIENIPALYYYFYSIGTGSIGISTFSRITEEKLNVLKRFRNVFDFAYRRYLDVAQAEAQAKEAKIEAALERVRSRTLAMQKSDELAETAAVVFRELIHLGIEPNRLYIGIINDDSGDMELWATDEDGSKVSTQFTGNINRNYSIRKMYEGWKEQKKSVTIDMQGKELTDYFHYLNEELKVPFKDGLSQKRRVQNIAYFAKGFIGIASPDPQPEKTILLLERFAAVFNLTYTRFNDLKLAEFQAEQAYLDLIKLQTEKKRAEEALTELRAAQTLLVQSEKMASLGELTAGIAHEIQNPLNFVNNFSEVSNELMDEMNAEIEKGDMEEAKVIASDIKQNLEKITHHGKRADAIVKSMLQHSRSSSGVKEPTNINALADEYLRLAYHGLRAKDMTFHATMKTDYDETIGSIEILSQDIGRVILNLITNAFYAVSEKKKSGIESYEPTVSVSTKKEDGHIEIKVADNGSGIPRKVLDKIFQPFFTTKPTGQGTGLGLSLSYDIIKAHGGEIRVKTNEGLGAEFVIQIPVPQ